MGGTWARTNLPAALASATYDAANQIATFGGVSFMYDSNGSLTGDGNRTYAWNARNQLASLSGAPSASFVYDGAARRRSKTIGGTTTGFLYDGLNPVQERVGGSASANLLTGLGIDQYFTRTTPSASEQFARDALGSTIALSDLARIVQTEYAYEAFGATTASGASSTNASGFTGRELDVSGLHYYRARFYDARFQRFIGEDPLGFAAGDANLYGYVGNNPVQQMDPLGLQLVSGSPHPWWVKPEEPHKPVVCVPPGGTYSGPIDGAGSPTSSHPGEVLKVPDYTWVIIGADGEPRVYTPPPDVLVVLPPPANGVMPPIRVPMNHLPGYGWKRPGFTPDPDWAPLFPNSAPPLDGRKPRDTCPPEDD